jgi:hypothetical protein
MSDETNREAAAVARTEADTVRLPWTTPKLSYIYSADAQIGLTDGIDLDFLS